MIYDLTTEEGRNAAMGIVANNNWLAEKLVSTIKDFFSNDKTMEGQKATAIELIKAGKNNNVDEIEIILEQDAGINIEAEVEGIPVKAMIGKDGKMKLKVKYK